MGPDRPTIATKLKRLTYLESLLNVQIKFGRCFHVAAVLHRVAHNFAGEFLFNFAIVFLVALVSHNHDWHVSPIAA